MTPTRGTRRDHPGWVTRTSAPFTHVSTASSAIQSSTPSNTTVRRARLPRFPYSVFYVIRGEVILTDAVFTLNHLFLGGEPPPSPYPSAGFDPTGDEFMEAGIPHIAMQLEVGFSDADSFITGVRAADPPAWVEKAMEL